MIGLEVVVATVVDGAALVVGGTLDDGEVVALEVETDEDVEVEEVVGREVELEELEVEAEELVVETGGLEVELEELDVEVLLSERYQFLGSSPRQEPTVTPVHPLAFIRSK